MNFAPKIILSTLLIGCLSKPSHAATIAAVKENKAIINLEGEQVQVGDSLYATNPESGKKTGLLKVVQIKNNKAMVEIVKGRAVKGGSILAKSATASATTSNQRSAPSTSTKKQSSSPDYSKAFEASKGNKSFGIHKTLRDSYGLLAGLQMNSMTTTASGKMSGSGFNVGGFYDYIFADSFAIEGIGTFEQFNVENTSTSSNVKIGYLSMYGLAKWYPFQSKFRAWVGGGLGLLYAVQKSSANALNVNSIASNQVFTANFGLDYQINKDHYIPVSFSYVLFPDSDKNVTDINSMQIKVGWAWNL